MSKRHILPLATLALLAGCSQTPTAPSELTIAPRFEGGIYAGSGNAVETPPAYDGGNTLGSGNVVDGVPGDTTGTARGGNTLGSGN